MVLPRLMTLIEKHVIDQMTKIVDSGGDVIEAVLKIVQPCQIHNADQLSDWCLSYIANNYNTACRRYKWQTHFTATDHVLSSPGFQRFSEALSRKTRPISTSTDGRQFGRSNSFEELQSTAKYNFRYLKDFDMYQRQLSEQKRSEKPSNLKRTRSVNTRQHSQLSWHSTLREPSGCLCFTNKSRKGSE